MAKSKNLNLTMIVSVLVILLIIGYLVYTGLNIKDNKETFNDNDYPECIKVEFGRIRTHRDDKEWYKGRGNDFWPRGSVPGDQLIYKIWRDDNGTRKTRVPPTYRVPYKLVYKIIPAHEKYVNHYRSKRMPYIVVQDIQGDYWRFWSDIRRMSFAGARGNISSETIMTGSSNHIKISSGDCPSNATTAMPAISNMGNVMWGSTLDYPNRRWWNRKRRTLENKKINPDVPTPLDKDEKSFVQCCPSNGEPTPGHFRRGKGVRWCPSRKGRWQRGSNYPGNDEAQWGADQRTYDEAKNICQNIKTQYKDGVHRMGIRRLNSDSDSSYDLCTQAQIESDDARRTGCFYNWENVWIKDEE